MVTYLLKKSYLRKDLAEIHFKDLWNDHGVFTTMWIFGKPPKILFYKEHISNLIRSLKIYKLAELDLKKKNLQLLKLNIKKNKNYNHLLRIAVNKKIISISLRKRIKPKIKFNLKLVSYKRIKPEHKNLKYKKILSYLSKMSPSESDIGLCSNGKILESGTSNILLYKNKKVYSPKNKFYKGVTYKFFEKKIKKIIKKDIMVNSLKEYDEVILIGSGKGVASIQTINDIKWKRKSLFFYKVLFNQYKKQFLKCPIYK